MNAKCLSVVALALTASPIAQASGQVAQSQTVVAITPDQVRWFTPAYYTDGRQRAQLFGDSGGDGPWIDRVKIPGNSRVRAHTHSRDEVVTVISGTWYMGIGARSDSTKLRAYPAGSFIVIPAGVPHFLATKDGPVIVQASGTGKFTTDYVEK